jgi:hypothetical protein
MSASHGSSKRYSPVTPASATCRRRLHRSCTIDRGGVLFAVDGARRMLAFGDGPQPGPFSRQKNPALTSATGSVRERKEYLRH